MSDNFTTPVAAGTTFSSKDIGGGVQVPRNIITDDAGANAVPELLSALALLATDAHAQAIITALGNTLSVSFTSQPLPTGASTDAKLETIRALLAAALTINLPTGASTAALQGTGNTSLASIVAALAGTLAISAASLPLPSGASTATNQAAQIARGSESYAFANALASLAAGAGTTPVTVPYGGYYFFDAFFAGTSPSLALQVLGSDGATWTTVVTVTATGAATNPVGIPSGSQVRLYNSGSNALTTLSGRLA